MAKINVNFECGCFKRSGYENGAEFSTLKAAKTKADEMVEDMNENFCGRHSFLAKILDKDILIEVTEN